MTWAEFKETIEGQGVKEDHIIMGVDWHPAWGTGYPEVIFRNDGWFGITYQSKLPAHQENKPIPFEEREC